MALMAEGRTAEAAVQFEATVRLRPASADAHHQLALVLGELGRTSEAMRHEREALRLRPDFAEAREHLEWLHDQ
jgi:Flp pilus assembly protein TadD